MRTGCKQILGVTLMLLIYFSTPHPGDAKTRKLSPPAKVTILPESREKIIPSYDNLSDFTFTISSDRPVKVYVRLVFENPLQEAQIFTNHIKWIKKNDGYYYTDMSGRPALLTLNADPQPLPLALKIKLTGKSPAKIEVVENGKTAAAARLTLVPLKNAEDLYHLGQKYPAVSVILLAFLGILIVVIFFYLLSKQQKKDYPQKMARGRFSTVIPENGQIFISEKENPFHCRLWGFNKKVRIHYSRAQIILQYAFRNKRFTDVYPVEIKINRYWTLKLTAEQYDNGGKKDRSLSVLLIPQD